MYEYERKADYEFSFIWDRETDTIKSCHTPEELNEWATWFSKLENRLVKVDVVNGLKVSTICVGTNSNFLNNNPPILFETMVFPGDSWSEMYSDRYQTYQQALVGHDKAVTMAEMCIFPNEPEDEDE